MSLNPKQKEAVEAPLSPALVIAGAGTGKTTVLIERIIYLISNGIKPEDILAITFTNKAKEEVRERISKALPHKVPQNIYTFHAFFHLMLRKDIDKLGREKNFRIVDDNDQRAIIRNIIKESKIDNKGSVKNWTNVIGDLKQRNEHGKPLKKTPYSLAVCKRCPLTFEELSHIYSSYQERLDEIKALDFNDLEILAQKLLDIEEVRKKWSDDFKAILIDEFQDINDIQFRNIKKLLINHQNIFCVGDPDQSIYGFRGAKPDICREFLDTFENSNLIKLEENYRSTKNILAVANQLINKNSDELSKNLFTNNEVGEKVIYKEYEKENKEIEWIISEIEKLIKEGAKLKDIAILYRSNSISKPFEIAIQRKGFDYSISNSVEFYAREEIRFVIAYLHLIFKDRAYDVIERIVNKPPRGIGEKGLANFITFMRHNRITTSEGFERIEECSSLTPKAISGFKEIGEIIKELKEYKDIELNELINKIVEESGYKAHVISQGEEWRLENVEQFGAILASENELSNEEIVNDIPLKSKNRTPDSNDFLLLSTVHQVKGLEFKYVFIIKMLADVFPSMLSKTDEDKKEERRLAYVAFTRAKKRLYISKSPLFRGTKAMSNQESEFVTDIKNLDMVEVHKIDSENLFKFKIY